MCVIVSECMCACVYECVSVREKVRVCIDACVCEEED